MPARPCQGRLGTYHSTSTHQTNPNKSKMSSKPSDDCVIVVPIEGSPYLRGITARGDNLDLLQDIVGGSIEGVRPSDVLIAPSFSKDNSRWALIETILKEKSAHVYANEEGIYKCSVNFGTYNKNTVSALQAGTINNHCPHYFGNLAVVINRKSFEKLGLTAESMKMED